MKYLILCLTLALSLTACQKMDDNGDLGGTWQLLSWETKADGRVVATKEDRIFYYFQGELMKTQILTEELSYLSTFHTTPDSLIVDRVYMRPNDTLVPVDSLRRYGATASGRFHFDVLSADRLVLSNEDNVLTFRKY